MNADYLDRIALNVVAGFLSCFNMVPSEDGLEVRDYGPHRVWTVQSEFAPISTVPTDPEVIYELLRKFLVMHNQLVTATRFNPYNVEVYTCPCGYGVHLYVSIYQ